VKDPADPNYREVTMTEISSFDVSDQTNAGLLAVINRSDPGDETQRNFRYQHAYGTILLIGAARHELPYIAVWCEHHEDLLGELPDHRVDGYQIKTRKPEAGAWDLKDEPLRESVKRFVELDKSYGPNVRALKFVSNAEFLDVGLDNKDKARLARSPIKFLQAVQLAVTADSIAEPFDKSLDELAKHCECSISELFGTIKKLELVRGPGRDSFDAEVAHDHVACHPNCSTLPAATLNSIRDELIQKVYFACALKVASPSKHWIAINGPDRLNPILQAKRIPTTEVVRTIQDITIVPFRYHPGTAPLGLGSGSSNMETLETKMLRGGLASQVLAMRARAISAEQRLMGRAHGEPDTFEEVFNQMVNVVHGECSESYLRASLGGEPFGPSMLDDIYSRLRTITSNTPAMVHGESYECLVGIVGLLSGACIVWWSVPFEIGGGE